MWFCLRSHINYPRNCRNGKLQIFPCNSHDMIQSVISFTLSTLQLLITIERIICLRAHKYTLHYINEGAYIYIYIIKFGVQTFGSDGMRISCTLCVYLYATIDRAHSYTLYWICTAPIYRITCTALFSVVIAVLIIDIILWFVPDGKILYPARTFGTRFSPFIFQTYLSIFLFVSPPSVLFPPVSICARQGKNERERKTKKGGK